MGGGGSGADGVQRVESFTPEPAVHPREPAHPVGDLIDRHRPGGVPWIGAPGDNVLHHHQEVGAVLVDQRRVDGRVIEGQFDTGGEQSRLVVQTAGERDEYVSAKRARLLVPSSRSATATPSTTASGSCRASAAVIQSGVMSSQPRGSDSSATVTLRQAYFRQLPPSTGSVTPVT